MKVLNNINIDFNSNSERVYECTIVCKDSIEVDNVFKAFENEILFIVDCFEDNEVTVISEAWRHSTKKDFLTLVKKTIRKAK